ncbi:MAG TPA: hypothetical protein VGG01_14165 [Xanthobacteraceae bacterium]|jgi:hypothetical protein
MRKFLTVIATTSALALVTVAAPTSADARCRGCGVAAGVIGGIAVGAAIAGATSGPYYNGPYAYDSGYAYEPGYAYGPGYAYDEAPGYGYRHYGGSSCDYKNFSHDRQLQGSC